MSCMYCVLGFLKFTTRKRMAKMSHKYLHCYTQAGYTATKLIKYMWSKREMFLLFVLFFTSAACLSNVTSILVTALQLARVSLCLHPVHNCFCHKYPLLVKPVLTCFPECCDPEELM